MSGTRCVCVFLCVAHQNARMHTHTRMHTHVNIQDGWTALHHACANASFECAVYLCMLGADVEALTPRDSTPLHCAAFAGEPNILRLLRVYSADMFRVNSTGRTALEVAQENKREDGAAAMQEPLHVAASKLLLHGETIVTEKQKLPIGEGPQLSGGVCLPRAFVQNLRQIVRYESRLVGALAPHASARVFILHSTHYTVQNTHTTTRPDTHRRRWRARSPRFRPRWRGWKGNEGGYTTGHKRRAIVSVGRTTLKQAL